jgi:hypothetical protein
MMLRMMATLQKLVMPPFDFLIEAVRDGVLVPAVVTAGILVAAMCVGRRHPEVAARVAGLFAVAAGFFAGYFALETGPWLPMKSWHWLPYIGLAASAAGMADLLPGSWFLFGWLLRPAVAYLAALLLVPDWAESRAGWLPGLSAAITVLWFLLDELARRSPGPLLPAQLLLTAVAGSVVLVQSGNNKFGQLCAVVAAVLGVASLAAWRRPPSPVLRGMVPGVAVLLPSLLVEGFLNNFGEVPWPSFVLVAFAPLTPFCVAFPPLQNLKPPWRPVLSFAIHLVPLAIAAALALRTGAVEY